jgi:hypothetical protein
MRSQAASSSFSHTWLKLGSLAFAAVRVTTWFSSRAQEVGKVFDFGNTLRGQLANLLDQHAVDSRSAQTTGAVQKADLLRQPCGSCSTPIPSNPD